VLWCLAIRHAILTGKLDARIGLQQIPIERRDLWVSRLTVAEASKPADFTNNGWVVEALQAAWSAITTTPIPTDHPADGVFRVDHLRLAIDAAVRGGNDTDTVAAIAADCSVQLVNAVDMFSKMRRSPDQFRRGLRGTFLSGWRSG